MKRIILFLVPGLLALGIGVGMRYILLQYGSETVNREAASQPSVIGLWRLREIYSYDFQNTKQWQRGEVPDAAFREFLANGKACEDFSMTPDLPCLAEGTYTMAGNIITISQPGTSGASFRYRPTFEGNQLELIAEAQVGSDWIPAIKQIMIRTSRPIGDLQ